MTASHFDEDTALAPPSTGPGAGRWAGTLSDRWDIGDKPNGGYLLAAAIRAMGGALGPEHPHPFSVNAHYLRPGEAGPVTVDVDIVRQGRTLSTVTGSLVQSGKERLRLLGSFGDLTRNGGPSVVAGSPPDLPPPEQCVSRNASSIHYKPSRIAENMEVLLNPATGWTKGAPSGVADISGWLRFTDGRQPDVLSLALFADAMPPAVFEVLPNSQWVPTVELTVHFRAVPEPGWLRGRFVTRFLVGGFFEEDGELWDSTGQLVAQSRQLAMVIPVPAA